MLEQFYSPVNNSDKNVLRRFNVVFLVRDPRDSVVSAYYERRLREKRKSTKIYSDINEFVKEQRGFVFSLFPSVLIFSCQEATPLY